MGLVRITCHHYTQFSFFDQTFDEKLCHELQKCIKSICIFSSFVFWLASSFLDEPCSSHFEFYLLFWILETLKNSRDVFQSYMISTWFHYGFLVGFWISGSRSQVANSAEPAELSQLISVSWAQWTSFRAWIPARGSREQDTFVSLDLIQMTTSHLSNLDPKVWTPNPKVYWKCGHLYL